jgi:hypothetical protein
MTIYNEIIANFRGPVRTERRSGKSWLVSPAVLITEGVHCGSNGCLKYEGEEIRASTKAWEGIPVCMDHPRDSFGTPISCNDPLCPPERILGKVRNPRFKEGKLLAELWLEDDRVMIHAPDVLEHLHGGCLEVSTGMFSDDREEQGTWWGKSYTRIARNLRPDHLAVLPNGQGACSWADGCGTPRTNQSTTNGEEPLDLPPYDPNPLDQQDEDGPLDLPDPNQRNQKEEQPWQR